MTAAVRLSAAAGSLLLAAAVAGPASAAAVQACNDYAMATYLAEPWEANSRTFYDGRVRVAVVDTDGEPACCSAWLVVIFPDPSDELGGRTCRMVGQGEGSGFMGVDVKGIRSTYDPARGLGLSVPVRTMADDGASAAPATVRLRLDLKAGTLRVE